MVFASLIFGLDNNVTEVSNSIVCELSLHNVSFAALVSSGILQTFTALVKMHPDIIVVLALFKASFPSTVKCKILRASGTLSSAPHQGSALDRLGGLHCFPDLQLY